MPKSKAPSLRKIINKPGPKPVERVSITPLMKEAAAELLKRRRARMSLLAFTKYTFPRFQANWHHELMCGLLERIDNPADVPTTLDLMINGQRVSIPVPANIRRFMCFAPPRHTKSELISIRRPAWSIGRDRRRMFINVTYGADLANTFSNNCMSVMKSKAYTRLFDVTFERSATERWKVHRSEADENGKSSMIAAGILSPLTGEGATDINVDDPFKNKSEAYSKLIRDRVADEYITSIRTRLQPGGSIALMLTRWHKDDLAGRLLEMAMKNPKADQWLVLCLPATNDDGQQAYVWNTRTGEKTYLPAYEALWPGWFDRESLDATQATMSRAFWMALYMQQPTAASGNIFKRENWGEFEGVPILERCVHVWDTALEDNDDNDYSAFEEMGVADNRYLITDACRERMAFPVLVAKVYEKWNAALARGVYPERCLIEQKGSGISLIQQIQANNVDPNWTGGTIPVLGLPANISKEIRALSVSGYHDAKTVSLPIDDFPSSDVNGDKADFIEEHADFPKGKHDDWVDCTVHALTYFTRPIQGEEHEEIIVYGDDYTLDNLLDQVDGGYY